MISIPSRWKADIEAGTPNGKRYSRLLAAAARDTRIDRKPGQSVRFTLEPVGAMLASKIEGLLGIKSKSGCKCSELADKMNSWGVKGCRARREEIVSAMVSNRSMIEDAVVSYLGRIGVLGAVLIGAVPDAVFRIGAGRLLDQAIEETETAANNERALKQQAKQKKPQRTLRERIPLINVRANRRGKPYTGWRSEADGPRIVYGPFASNVRHLTYHVWGSLKHDSWKWNLQQLSTRWELFNGKKIIGISSDEKSVDPDSVVAYASSLGMNFDTVIRRKNVERLREVVTWLPMLQQLNPSNAADDEVVFSAHAKGQKYDDANHTRDWTDLMYRTCLDNWPAVHEALRTSLMAGSFKEYGLLGKGHNWAYSGTFFWWRLAEIGKRKWSDVDQWFAGTESWPGKLCDPRETACLFLNDSRRMYDSEYWQTIVWNEWKKHLEEIQ